ncbi:PBP1A family penicillin-binding protein [Halobacillus rhizosphaerae]|uniref:transglycosylase domain-containing protein n=1 Tax=Halobacillus rhizosphaerae TaxID=3064889 RepID=UPI00398B3CDC
MRILERVHVLLNIKDQLPDFPRWIRRFKWPVMIVTGSLLLALLGYFIIIFGGRVVVDDKKLVFDSLSTVETKDGQVIEEIYSKHRQVVPLSDIPKPVQNAFVAIEDSRFYQHAGIDVQSIGRAIFRDVAARKKVEGGSTITQQLVKNVYLTNDKTYMRKTKEVMGAIYLERNYSKDELLELYLNQIYFGDGVYGIGAAARHYFNKDVSELSTAQGALLAGLPKAPNHYSPFDHPQEAKRRRDLVLSRMEDLGMIKVNKMLRMQGTTLAVSKTKQKEETWSNSYVDLVIQEAADRYNLSRDELKRGGYRIVAEMDPDIQRIAAKQMKNGEFVPGSKKQVEGALTMMDTSSGAIVAAVGGRNFNHGDLNRVMTKHQPGSTIKPLAVYGPALSGPRFVPYSLLVDEPNNYGDYQPRNYDDQYNGAVSLYEALVESKNAPAVWLLDQIGISNSKEYLKNLGLETSDKGLAIALGGLSKGYSTLQMTDAYGSLANNGKVMDSFTIQRIIDRNGKVIERHTASATQVFNKQAAWDLTEMLQTTVEAGTAKPGSYSKALAGKTGTQQHPTVKGKNKDVWFAGYTPEYAGSLWMGYDQAGKDYYLNGGSEYPTKLMKSILTEIDQRKNLKSEFPVPEGVKSLPKPVHLPEIKDLTSQLSFGGISLLKGELEWTPAGDNRIIYRIYRVEDGDDVNIGEVKGKGTYTVTGFNVFKQRNYYVVPVDPLTGREGDPSNQVSIQFKL